MAASSQPQFPSFDLSGKRVLVTGASKGIGRHAALSLAHAGADVFLSARNQAELDMLAQELRALGRRAETFAAELADLEQIQRLSEAALAAMGGIDVLVNNAGIARIEPFFEVSPAAWDETMDVNLRAPLFLAQSIARHMVARGQGGKIINIASQAALVGLEGHAAYCASKSGLVLLTKVMALELGRYNIQVNTVCPTVILTPMGEQVWGDPAKGDPMKAKIPLGKFGYPVDVSGTIIFLASNASAMITGTEIVIDGGYTAI